MPLEIELKAHVVDCALLEQRLGALGTYCHSYTKSDSYWVPLQEGAGTEPSPSSGVRVRRENTVDTAGNAHESILVTYKDKHISGGIEVNNEREFTVSDAALFEELLERLGLYKIICKEKQGKAWRLVGQRSVLAELSLVTDLGWFLELEIIADHDDGQTVDESRKELFALLEKLEIPADRIEERPYTMMLRELQFPRG